MTCRVLVGVQALTESSEEAVAAIYARNCAPLIGLLTSIGGSHADAEEVAQDAFVKLLLHWHKVGGYQDPESWVRAVAVRLLISRWRRSRVAALGARRLSATVINEPEVNADAVAVSAALAQLPLSQRAVVILHHVMDLPVEQVAADLGIPTGTVKSRLARGRAALAVSLRDIEESGHV